MEHTDIKRGRHYIFTHTHEGPNYKDPWTGTVCRITKANPEGGFHTATFGPDLAEGLVGTNELTEISAGMRLTSS